jgi:hypothetical protein
MWFRKVFLVGALLPLGLLAMPAPPAATVHGNGDAEDWKHHPMPPLDQGFQVVVQPGEQIEISGTFLRTYETAVQIYEHASGNLLAGWYRPWYKPPSVEEGESPESEILMTIDKPFVSPVNESKSPVLYLIVSRHRARLVTGWRPWAFSTHRLLIGKPAGKSIVLGFDDGYNDLDFNDVVLNIRHLSPQKQDQ